MKALDIVKTKNGSIAIVTETHEKGAEASIEYIKGENKNREKNAWWKKEELTVIDNIPNILARTMCHPFGSGDEDVSLFF